MNNSINASHADKFRVNFSNVPGLASPLQLGLYDNFVRSVTIPDYNMEESFSPFRNEIYRNPISKKNDALSQIQIDFKTDENLDNYYNLLTFMQKIRYGEIDAESLRKSAVNAIEVEILDNQKRIRGTLKFTECYLLSLSSLPLVMGSSEEVVFTCNFSYEEIQLTKSSI